jgi:hypothetical protein
MMGVIGTASQMMSDEPANSVSDPKCIRQHRRYPEIIKTNLNLNHRYFFVTVIETGCSNQHSLSSVNDGIKEVKILASFLRSAIEIIAKNVYC